MELLHLYLVPWEIWCVAQKGVRGCTLVISINGSVDGSYRHELVLMDYDNPFVWLKETLSCSMKVVANAVRRWCLLF